MKHVPDSNKNSENKEEPTEEVPAATQLQILREKLLVHNKAFKACRAKFGLDIEKNIRNLETKDPTDFCRRWDALSGNIRVMGNLLEQFRRDNLSFAYLELSYALTKPGYVLPGEVIPLEETAPLTVLMFRPADTLTLLTWLVSPAHMENLATYLRRPETRDDEDASLTRQVFHLFPRMQKEMEHCLNPHSSQLGYDVVRGYGQDLADIWPQVHTRRKMRRLKLDSGHLPSSMDLHKNEFAWYYWGEQSEILSQYPRDEQDQIGTWQFRVPKMIGDKFLIGLHPESEHDQWKKDYPSLLSAGFCAGKGGIVFCNHLNEHDEKNPYLIPIGGKILKGQPHRVLLVADERYSQ